MNLPVRFDYWTESKYWTIKSSALKRAGVHPHSAPAGVGMWCQIECL